MRITVEIDEDSLSIIIQNIIKDKVESHIKRFTDFSHIDDLIATTVQNRIKEVTDQVVKEMTLDTVKAEIRKSMSNRLKRRVQSIIDLDEAENEK